MRALLLVLCAALCAACPGPQYPKCDEDKECVTKDHPEVCVFGQCAECALDKHCGDGKICKSYHCEARPGCTADGDCKEGFTCKAHVCTVECKTNAECTAPRQCEQNKCALPQGSCVDNNGCSGGQACRDNRCFTPMPNDPEYTAVYGTPATTPQTSASNSGVDVKGVRTLCGVDVRVYFPFNESVLNSESRKTLESASACLRKTPNLAIVIQGHTDERGSTEYNLALGERRALVVQGFLKDLGVSLKQMSYVSVGKERPLDPGHDEAAWAKNRRAEVLPKAL